MQAAAHQARSNNEHELVANMRQPHQLRRRRRQAFERARQYASAIAAFEVVAIEINEQLLAVQQASVEQKLKPHRHGHGGREDAHQRLGHKKNEKNNQGCARIVQSNQRLRIRAVSIKYSLLKFFGF